MHYFWLICFCIIISKCQEPPKANSLYEKTGDISQELTELRDSYKEFVDFSYAATLALLQDKGAQALDSSRALNFSCIIDRQNDQTILDRLVAFQKHFEQLLTLEEKLERTDRHLTHNPHDMLKKSEEHIDHLRIGLELQQLFKTLLDIKFAHEIRRIQNGNRIRGMFPHFTSP